MRPRPGEPLAGRLPLLFLGMLAFALGALSAWWLLTRFGDRWLVGPQRPPSIAIVASPTPPGTPAAAVTPSPAGPVVLLVPVAPHGPPPAPPTPTPSPAPTLPAAAAMPATGGPPAVVTPAPWPATAPPTPVPAMASPPPPLPAPEPSPTPLPSPTPTAAPVLRGIVSSDFGGGVVVRARPTTASPAVGSLPSGTEVVVFERVVGEAVVARDPYWYAIGYGALRGYVYGRLVTLLR